MKYNFVSDIYSKKIFCIFDINLLYITCYIGAELVRGRVCQGPSLWGPSLLGAEIVRGQVC